MDPKWVKYLAQAGDLVVGGGVLTWDNNNRGNAMLVQTDLPIGDWEFTTKITTLRNYYDGLAVTSTDGSKALVTLYIDGGTTALIQRLTNASPSSNSPSWAIAQVAPLWARVGKVGEDIIFSDSLDGVTFTTRHTEAISNHLGSATQVGLYSAKSLTSATAQYDWFRKTQ